MFPFPPSSIAIHSAISKLRDCLPLLSNVILILARDGDFFARCRCSELWNNSYNYGIKLKILSKEALLSITIHFPFGKTTHPSFRCLKSLVPKERRNFRFNDYSQNHAIPIRRTCCAGRSIVERQGWGNDRETIGLTGEIHSDCDLKVGYISGKKQFTPSSMVQRPGDLRNRGHMILRGVVGKPL